MTRNLPRNIVSAEDNILLLQDAVLALCKKSHESGIDVKASIELKRCVRRIEMLQVSCSPRNSEARKHSRISGNKEATTDERVYVTYKRNYYQALANALMPGSNLRVLQNILFCSPFFSTVGVTIEGRAEISVLDSLVNAAEAFRADVYTHVLILEALIHWHVDMQDNCAQKLMLTLVEKLLGDICCTLDKSAADSQHHKYTHHKEPVCVVKRIFRLVVKYCSCVETHGMRDKSIAGIGRLLHMGMYTDTGLVQSMAPEVLRYLLRQCPVNKSLLINGCLECVNEKHSITRVMSGTDTSKEILPPSDKVNNVCIKASLYAWKEKRYNDDPVVLSCSFQTFGAILDKAIDLGMEKSSRLKFITQPFISKTVAKRVLDRPNANTSADHSLRTVVLHLWMKTIVKLDRVNVLMGCSRLLTRLVETCASSHHYHLRHFGFGVAHWILRSLTCPILPAEEVRFPNSSSGDETDSSVVQNYPVLLTIWTSCNTRALHKHQSTNSSTNANESENTKIKSTKENTKTPTVTKRDECSMVVHMSASRAHKKQSHTCHACPTLEMRAFVVNTLPAIVSCVTVGCVCYPNITFQDDAHNNITINPDFPLCLHLLMVLVHRFVRSPYPDLQNAALNTKLELCRIREDVRNNRDLRIRWGLAYITALVSSHEEGSQCGPSGAEVDMPANVCSCGDVGGEIGCFRINDGGMDDDGQLGFSECTSKVEGTNGELHGCVGADLLLPMELHLYDITRSAQTITEDKGIDTPKRRTQNMTDWTEITTLRYLTSLVYGIHAKAASLSALASVLRNIAMEDEVDECPVRKRQKIDKY
eukprot:CFRG0733T1